MVILYYFTLACFAAFFVKAVAFPPVAHSATGVSRRPANYEMV